MSGAAVPGQAAGVVDLTPDRVDNWLSMTRTRLTEREPVLCINQTATLHHRVALAWSMATELRSIVEVGAMLQDGAVTQDYMCALQTRLESIERLLESIGGQTASGCLSCHLQNKDALHDCSSQIL